MKVTVIGTGYVGLVTGTCLAEHGHEVVCVDKISEKIDMLQKGLVPIYEPGLKELIDRNVAARRLSFTVDGATPIANSEVVFIAVGTPPGPEGEADLTYVKDAAQLIGQAMRGYRVIVNKSTVPVGTADLVAGILAAQTPFPFDVVSNPEFLREGVAVEDCLHPDRIVVGARTHKAIAVIQELYRTYEAPIVVTDPRSAEMIKYAANAFLATKISFINEVAGLCERLGCDVNEVARGIGLDRRIGQAFLKAGVGYGGSCFPKDTQALVHMANRTQYDMPLVSAAMDVNHKQRVAIVAKLRAALGSFEGRVVGILGLAFKPHTDDLREAPAFDIIQAILTAGGSVRVFDPKGMENAQKEWPSLLPDGGRGICYCADPASVGIGADALCLVTEWPEFATLSWEDMHARMHQHFLIDARNFLSPEEMRNIGFKYAGVGRGVPDITAEADPALVDALLGQG